MVSPYSLLFFFVGGICCFPFCSVCEIVMCEHSEKWVSLRNCLEFLNQTALEKNEWIPSQDPWGEGDEEKRKELFWKMRRKISLVSQSRLKTNQEPLLFFLEEILPVKRGKSKLFQSPKILSRFVGLMKEAHSISDPSLLPWAEFFHCLFEHRSLFFFPVFLIFSFFLHFLFSATLTFSILKLY